MCFSKASSRYYIIGPSSELETIMDLESDRFKNLEYTEEDFRREALAVLGEYNKNISKVARQGGQIVLLHLGNHILGYFLDVHVHAGVLLSFWIRTGTGLEHDALRSAVLPG